MDASGKNKPYQAHLKRAISTVYYAMFHTMARNCADMLVGSAPAHRSASAWRQMYRGIDHGLAKTRCEATLPNGTPQEIQDFADHFVAMQIKRHEADYDLNCRFAKTAVISDMRAAEAIINAFNSVSAKDRRAFAVWVLLKPRPK